MAGAVSELVEMLSEYKSYSGVFNPWCDFDEINDALPEAPLLRRAQLIRYLEERIESGKAVMVGEAIGYQGGKFTGIPLMSERILTGKHEKIFSTGIKNLNGIRTSKVHESQKSQVRANGYAEPTATIVWGETLHVADKIINWNAFPFHPYLNDKGYLSNRSASTFTQSEKEIGKLFIDRLLSILSSISIHNLGNSRSSI